MLQSGRPGVFRSITSVVRDAPSALLKTRALQKDPTIDAF
jgi:hypothetical protein